MVLLVLVTVTTGLQCSLNGSKSPNLTYLEIGNPLGPLLVVSSDQENVFRVHLFPGECHGNKMSLHSSMEPFIPLQDLGRTVML